MIALRSMQRQWAFTSVQTACAAALLVGALAMAEPPALVYDIVPDIMPGDVELAVIPRPKRERMKDTMVVVGKAVVCSSRWDDLRAGRRQLAELLGMGRSPDVVREFGPAAEPRCDTLVLIGTAEELQPMKRYLPPNGLVEDILPQPRRNVDQSYYLCVRSIPGQESNVVVIMSPTSQGAFYAIQTLRQVTYASRDKIYIREGEIDDWPTFRGRGGKRTVHPWVYAFKCNLHYEHGGRSDVRRDNFGHIWIAGIFPHIRKGKPKKSMLDATPAAIEKYVANMKKMHERGASDYRIHVDDQPLVLTPETAKLFNDDYYAAMRHLVREFHKAMKLLNPDATLYLAVQPYWTLTPYEDYAAKLWAGEQPPEDLAMAINGPQVTSEPVPPDEVRSYSKAFGAARPALIVDWHGRGKSFGPIEARQAALADYAVGVAPGSGTATMRATRLDWGWNPKAYDRDRSLMLACREFAGFEHWKDLYELVTSLECAAPGTQYEPREQALAKYEAGLDRCAELLERMKQLPDMGMKGRVQPPKMKDPTKMLNFAQHVPSHIEPTLKELREKKLPVLRKYGFREAAAVRTRGKIAVDGNLDERIWRVAPPNDPFIAHDKPVPEDQQTEFKVAYDETHLYFAWRMRTPKPVDPTVERTVLGLKLPTPTEKQTGHDMRGIFALHGWECVALMLDPKHTQTTDVEFQLDAAGRRADGLFEVSGDQSPNGLAWDSQWTSAVKLNDKGWTAEMAIPWKDLGVAPRAGHVMGLQVWRTGVGVATSIWSVTPRWWGAQSPSQFGHLILK